MEFCNVPLLDIVPRLRLCFIQIEKRGDTFRPGGKSFRSMSLLDPSFFTCFNQGSSNIDNPCWSQLTLILKESQENVSTEMWISMLFIYANVWCMHISRNSLKLPWVHDFSPTQAKLPLNITRNITWLEWASICWWILYIHPAMHLNIKSIPTMPLNVTYPKIICLCHGFPCEALQCLNWQPWIWSLTTIMQYCFPTVRLGKATHWHLHELSTSHQGEDVSLSAWHSQYNLF